MKEKKKMLAALLLSVLCAFSGCGRAAEGTHQVQDVHQEGMHQETGTNQEQETYVQPEMEGEITISCFFEEEFLTAAARQFEKLYPDVKVTIHVYDDASEAASEEDYQTYLNTKIITGKAEDIIFNSFLPVTKYSKMGVFEDLSRYIALTPELNDENYFMNVLQAAKEENGELYLIPYIARFDVASFSEELLSEQPELENKINSACFSERMAVAKELIQNTGKSNVFLIHENELSYIDYLFKDSFQDFIDIENQHVNIKSDAYVSLLNDVKELAESGAFDSGNVDFYNTEYYFAVTCDYDVQAAFYELDANAGLSHGMPVADKEGNAAINANGCFALNSASEHKDLAWEFMKFLLSEEVQSLPSVHGLAVNRAGFDAAVQRYYSFYTDSGNDTVDQAAYAQLLEGWMRQINDCDTVDSAIWLLIEEENNKFIEGKQTAEETASNLQRKIEQYFYE